MKRGPFSLWDFGVVCLNSPTFAPKTLILSHRFGRPTRQPDGTNVPNR